MDFNKYLRSLSKEFTKIIENGILERDTQKQVAIELLDDEYKDWGFYITPHYGQFAGIQHDFKLIIYYDEGYIRKRVYCNTITCHPNVSRDTDVCINIDDGVNTLLGYANVLLWLMINPDYSSPFPSYKTRVFETKTLTCFNESQLDKYYKGRNVPLILINDKLMDDSYRTRGSVFKIDDFKVVQIQKAPAA